MPRVARVAHRATGVKLFLEVDDLEAGAERVAVDGAQPYEDTVASSPPAERIERDPDDVLLLYTGGTTGMPKGAMTKNAAAVVAGSTSTSCGRPSSARA